MSIKLNFIKNYKLRTQSKRKFYIPVVTKFYISHFFAIIWLVLSIIVANDWILDLSKIVSMPVSIAIVGGIALIPGYINTFLVISLLLDNQPNLKDDTPKKDVTILIAARNEEKRIEETLKYISNQDYEGKIKVIIIDNASSDNTSYCAAKAGEKFNMDLQIIKEASPGKFNALNTGLGSVSTELVITVDADTLLHKSAVRYLVARIESSPSEVCAVAGSVLVRNSRYNLLTRIQEWDYFLGIASIKRLQGLYQGTLVVQGAYSIYKADVIKEVGGWPDAIGEDIVLTWNFLKNGWKTYFEPLAVAFTDVPTTFKSLSRQRSRWARGMIEALKNIKPWQQPSRYTKYLTGVNLIMPYMDISYTFFWLPGLVLAFSGIYWIVGPMTLLVLPMTLISYTVLFLYQRDVFGNLKLRVRKNWAGFILFILCYQMFMTPISVLGYLQELFKLKRLWK